ncbi:hypothetical protein ACR77J_08220 [Tissierella praeacuta]|uniref:hypothetical protein n=1 Tax=Tissierella praeacuta TaxID=43131 RepID=UPI003DA3C650
MERSLPCEKHEEQIKTLFKRVDDMDNMRGLIHSIDKNMAVQTQMLKEMSEHNKRQDKRMDEQHEINIKMSDNLSQLAEQYNRLDDKVDSLENGQQKLARKVEDNDEKHKIDKRDIEKSEDTKILSWLYKWGTPIGLLGLLVSQVYKIIKR